MNTQVCLITPYGANTTCYTWSASVVTAAMTCLPVRQVASKLIIAAHHELRPDAKSSNGAV